MAEQLAKYKHKRSQKFERNWDLFEEAQSLIEETQGEDENERENFENNYFAIIANAEEIIIRYNTNINQQPNNNANNSVNNQDTEQQSLNSQLKLPRINLPTFNGSYEEWYPFYDTFQSMIHTNNTISKIQKFHYLKSSLKDEAAQAIHSLELSADNYDDAWEILKTRYDNKRIIVQNHIKSIFDLPALQRENHSILRQILDGVLKHLRALKSLKRPTESWDDLIMHIILTKLDTTTIKEWETSLTKPELPTLKEMTDFPPHKCHTLEAITKRPQQPSGSNTQQRTSYNKGTTAHTSTNQTSCQHCKGDHYIYQCNSFHDLPVSDRIKETRAKKMCSNCLKNGSHTAKECKYGACKKCNKKHHTLLHPSEHQKPKETGISSKPEENSTAKAQPPTTTPNHSSHSSNISQILLSTAIIDIYDHQGNIHKCRALLDSGSQSNFISEDLATRLGLKKKTAHVPVAGINSTITHVHNLVEARVKSKFNAFKADIDCLVLKRITENLPSISFNPADLKIPNNIKMADPKFYESSKIDILLGAELFWDLMCIGQIKLARDQPCLQKSHCGWIIFGKHDQKNSTAAVTTCHLSINEKLDATINKFWEIEHDLQFNNSTPEGRSCERHYNNTYRRTPEGRFVVQLPIIREKLDKLGDSYETARKRFMGLERKLNNQPELKREYTTFIQEYEKLGHMKEISDSDDLDNSKPKYYLPHHAVIKETSTTTKLRVVFDGSCKTTSGISLNDTMLAVPTLQEDLFSILARFRTFQHAITADISKMYRQVLLDPSQTRLQRILWRNEPHDEIKTYELSTVTYGTTSASYLAIKSLMHLAWLERNVFPIGSLITLRDFYVDDLLTGANSISEVLLIREETINLFKKGGFDLRKWASNCPEVPPDSPSLKNKNDILTLDKSENTRTLGIQWNTTTDSFQYTVPPDTTQDNVSKRTILSSIAQIFDPLGLLGPIIVTAKILIQVLWQIKADWDESVPASIYCKWKQYQLQLLELNNLKIPRKILPDPHPKIVQIHGFCDASQEAYGACIYIRATYQDNKHPTQLICSKSRVAPLKNTSLPRLELCGELLLAQQMNKLVQILHLEITSIHYWTDSTIVLNWINSPSRKWNVYVANRVGQIQEISEPSSWHHVSTTNNPADIVSRGMSPSELFNSALWWHGPSWLSDNQSHWPCSSYAPNYEETAEQRTIINASAITHHEFELFNKCSSFDRLIRITALSLRFINNSRQEKKNRTTGYLTTQELSIATKCLVKIIQASIFSEEIKSLVNNNEVSRESKLLNLNPFLDEQRIIRVGGRLRNSQLPYSTKHSIVLPSHHPFTTLLIQSEHIKQMHTGALATLAKIRTNYWPLAARNTVRHIIRKCVKCFKASPRYTQHLMGNLPTYRAEPTRPFNNSGVDYFGPLYIRDGKRRNSKTVKSYAAIFVCFATRAEHIELVSDMTTESFLNALKRFIARRGRPANIFSDNGTNFVGANRELNELRELFDSEQLNSRYTHIFFAT